MLNVKSLGLILFLSIFLSSVAFADINTHSDFNSSHLEISDNNLLGYWNFDSDCGNSSSSCTPSISYDMTGMNDGTYEGDAYVSDGLYDNSLSVDGDGDYLNIPPYVLLGNFSYSFFIKTSSVSNYAKIIGTSVSTGTNTDSGILFRTGMTGTLLCDISSSNIETSTIDTGTIVTTDDWVNIVLTGNREGDAIIYINGISSGSTDISAHSGNTIEGIAQFGTTLLSLSSGMDGLIDEVMFFNKTLTGTEVADIYNNQSNRFKTQGNITLKTINTNNTENNIASLSIDSESTKNITASLGRWGMSDGYNTHDNLVMHLPMENYTLGLMSDGVDDYVNTGIVPDENTEIEIDGKFLTLDTSAKYIGARGTSNRFYFGVNGGKWYAYFGDGAYGIYGTQDINNHKFRLGGGKFYIDNVEVIDTEYSTFSPITETLSLFAINRTGSSSFFADFEINYAKIWQDGILVRNFQPKSNGCFQELVNDVEYCNDGLGDLKVTTTNIKDISNNNLQPLTIGEVDCTVYGKYSTGCSFLGNGDTDDIITVEHNDALDYTDAGMSWSFYRNIKEYDSVNIMSKHSDNTGYELITTSNGEGYKLIFYNGTDFDTVLDTTTSAPLNQWVHTIITLKGQDVRIYQDNKLVKSDTLEVDYNGFANNEDDLIIGHRNLNGTMDDVMIFNKSLSRDEVAEIYTSYKFFTII